MTTLALAPAKPRKFAPIAPWTHTALLAAIFIGVAGGGALLQRHAQADPTMLQRHQNIIPLYLSLIAMEWGLFFYVKNGLRNGCRVRDLVGGRWGNKRDIFRDLALALGLWLIWTALQLAWDRWLGAGSAASVQVLLPRGWLDIALWCGVCVSAGCCEELVFRGYFQRQFEALTQTKWLAACAQALLFGIAHGYQGFDACARIALYALLFSGLAAWRRSLRPGMLAHAWTDLMAGIFAF